MKAVSAVFVSLFIAVGIIAKADGMSIRGNTKSANKLMKFARRLYNYGGGQYGGGNGYGGQYGQQQEMDEESMYFLREYSIKLLSCIAGEQVINYESGEFETSTVVFRLCPSNSCDPNNALGCDSGYGDFAVGINTFLEAYVEQQNEQQNNNGGYNNYYGNGMIAYSRWGEAFDASEYLECAAYNVEGADQDGANGNQYYAWQNYNGQNNGQYNNNYQSNTYQSNGNIYSQQSYNNNNGQRQLQNNNYYGNYYSAEFYIGPTCSADGTTIGLGMFIDDFCSYPWDANFADVASGWDNLPFSDGGMVSMNCVACYGPDADYNWELSEICTQPYQFASSRCDNELNTYSYYQNQYGCSYLNTLVEYVYGSPNSTNETEAEVYYDDENTQSSYSSNMSLFKWGNTWGDTANEVAAIVLFTLSVVLGAGLATCLCVKKRKERKRRKKVVAATKGDDFIPPPAEPIVKKRSSVIALVRSGSKSIKESVKTAATGAKMIVTTAASKSVASVKSMSKKKEGKEGKEGDDDTVDMDYKDMDDHAKDFVNMEDDNKSAKSGKVSLASVNSETKIAAETSPLPPASVASVISETKVASKKPPLPPTDAKSVATAKSYKSVKSGKASVTSGKASVASGKMSVKSVKSGKASVVASGNASVASGKASVASGKMSVKSVKSGKASVASGKMSVKSVKSGKASVASEKVSSASVASGKASVASVTAKSVASVTSKRSVSSKNSSAASTKSVASKRSVSSKNSSAASTKSVASSSSKKEGDDECSKHEC